MVNPSFIPHELVEAWVQTVQTQLSTLLQTPQVTLGHLEELLEVQGRTLLLPILSAAAHVLAARQAFHCPVCQQPLLAEARDCPRRLATVFGAFTFKRDYGWCPTCARYGHPADHALGLEPQAPASPRVHSSRPSTPSAPIPTTSG